MATVTGVLGTGVTVYLVLAGALFALQRSILYQPPAERPRIADYAVPGLAPVTVRTEDGLDLVHWYRPPVDPEGPVVVVFHGNAGHIGHRVAKFGDLLGAGVGVLFAEYRGYGGNPGQPTEAGLTADGRSAMAYLAAQGIAPARTVVYGESLGTAVAVKMAAGRPVAGIVLEAPFTSMADVAQTHYWYLPVRWLLLDQWRSAAGIAAVTAPLLVLHGERDRTVPVTFGRGLLAAAPGPKDALFVAGAGHNDLYDFPQVPERVLAFIRGLAAT